MNPEARVIIVSDSKQLASQLEKFFSSHRDLPASPKSDQANVSAGKPCPKCGAGRVLESRFRMGQYYCSSYKEGCAWRQYGQVR